MIYIYNILPSSSRAWHKWISVPEKLDLVNRGAGRIANRQLGRAFNQWYDVHTGGEHARRSLAHFVHRGLWMGLAAWLDFLDVQVCATNVIMPRGWRLSDVDGTCRR